MDEATGLDFSLIMSLWPEFGIQQCVQWISCTDNEVSIWW